MSQQLTFFKLISFYLFAWGKKSKLSYYHTNLGLLSRFFTSLFVRRRHLGGKKVKTALKRISTKMWITSNNYGGVAVDKGNGRVSEFSRAECYQVKCRVSCHATSTTTAPRRQTCLLITSTRPFIPGYTNIFIKFVFRVYVCDDHSRWLDSLQEEYERNKMAAKES